MRDILSQNIWDQCQYQQHNLGELGVDKWGRKYRYVQNGAATLTTGNLLQEAAEATNFRSMACQAITAIGATKIPVTLGGTAVTANQFESGDLVVESSTGIGQLFKIVRHDVQTSTTGTCNFYVDRPVKIALATTSQISVRKNSCDGVVATPITTDTGGEVGIALYAMTISYYGWVISGGDCAALFDNADNTSNGVRAIRRSLAVAGSVCAMAAADVSPTQIGWSREVASTDSTMGFVHLTID